ncbi:uncharacterized protein LOC132793295 [Drosophila nasuta]|uniref:uncharacterized protein LOC132793295 n=1 Tax=Drosophila nasuta TaxID=42062 RepID=UPI00295E4DAF|nr:uncharacterized protein LOC132793295 [Drosophila nasuta]
MYRICRHVALPRTLTLQCSNNFFKMSFKSPTVPSSVSPAATPTAQSSTQQQQRQRKKSFESKPMPLTIEESAVGNKEQAKAMRPVVTTVPQINIKDQRDKWLAKVSPGGMQRKAKARPATETETKTKPSPMASFVGANNATNFGKSSNAMPEKQQPDDEQLKDAGSVAERKSWMHRMHGAQQQKQAQWLKDMQAKQQAGRDIQQQKMQQLKPQAEITKATANPKTAVKSAPEPEPEPEPEPKSPERLAYLDTIRQLNAYQAHEPTAGRAKTKTKTNKSEPNIEHTLQCLRETGYEQSELESIPVIQVAGTKGRGSTCLLVEAILLSHGVKTGVLCAPHLFVTNERIRIDGEAISDAQFTELFQQLQTQLAQMQPPPSYQKLLMIMACHAFRNAKVDVAIIEVGSACASDCTNIMSHTKTIGISTLGWEQSFSLSNSLRDIAWAKAAIMKPEASIYTSATQPECFEVLSQRAKQLGLQLHRVPSYAAYAETNFSDKKLLNSANFAVKLNGSLAIQLAYDYLRRHRPEYVTGLEHNATQLTPGATRGLETYVQRGQFEVMKHDMFNVYMDSADTLESMMMCREWFYTRTRSSRAPKVLLFSKVNEFNSKDLLTILRHNVRFEEAGFVPSPSLFEGEPFDVATKEQDKATKDAITWHSMEELQRARRNASNWRSLCEEDGTRDTAQLSISIESFFDYLKEKHGNQRYGMRKELDVLVTGSRELVAGTITWLQKMKDAQFKQWH